MNSIFTSVLFESNSYFGNSKAIFTIHTSTSQILVVNSVACQLLNYSSDELCSIKFETLIQDFYRAKWSNYMNEFFQNSLHMSCSKEKLVELITSNDDIIVVSLYLKKLENSEKGLIIAEKIHREGGLIKVDQQGKILTYDEKIAFLFQYDSLKLVGISIYTLLPSLHLKKNPQGYGKVTYKQFATARTRNNDVVPISLTISSNNSNSEIIQILVWAYPDMSGLIVLNEEFLLKNCTHYFIKLMFGYSLKNVINKPISYFIPTFFKDVKLDEHQQEQSEFSHSCNNSFLKTFRNEKSTSQDNVLSMNDTSYSKSSSISGEINSENINESADFCENDSSLKTLFTQCGKNTLLKSQDSDEEKIFSCLEVSAENKDDDCFEEYSENIVDENIFSEYFAADGIKFIGYGKHDDGSYIDIKYQVKKVDLDEEAYYCVWISSDWYNSAQFRTGSNVSRSSSLNNSSVDGFFTKDSTYNESCNKLTNISTISQCDEVLTAGKYSLHYTNVMEIGKGAFGYVKMAFRNSDGLLVVTKFIKKKKVNISSWVYHPELDMKIPLEISLLTMLQHPNIVRVLDVFHNDYFVQLVMEKHGAGFDLFEFIDRGPKCDEKLKSYIFRQIVSAVSYLDSLGILHRDIKDENVIINEKFEIKLIDFGSAAFMPADESFSKFYGTLKYCSPEVLQGNRYKGPEIEIWALGVTLYILTFGENPFNDVEDTMEGHFAIPLPISQELNDLLHKMLDKNVDTRITIGEVAENVWINQPVDIENYKFEEVVRCHKSEAHPPKYIYEIQDFYPKRDSQGDCAQIPEDYSSDGSFQCEILEDDTNQKDTFFDVPKLVKIGDALQRRDTSPILFASTPIKKRNFRLCKSAIGMRKYSDNISTANEFTLASLEDSKSRKKSNLNASSIKQFNKSSPNLIRSLKKDTFKAWDNMDEELQAQFDKGAFAEAESLSSKDQNRTGSIQL